VTANPVGSLASTVPGASTLSLSGLNAGTYTAANPILWNAGGSAAVGSAGSTGTVATVTGTGVVPVAIEGGQYGFNNGLANANGAVIPGKTPVALYPVASQDNQLGGQPATTITFAKKQSYFGFDWNAADAPNQLSSYNGNNLVASFTASQLTSLLPPGYAGNPVNGADKGEDFAFLNFFGSANNSWNRIVISDPTASGFESQNWATAVANPALYGGLPGSTALLDVVTQGGVSTTNSVYGISQNAAYGNNLVITSPYSPTYLFATAAPNLLIQGGAPVHGGVGVANPEPSAYLTFTMLGMIVLVVARKRDVRLSSKLGD
jgi:hypothetical protein